MNILMNWYLHTECVGKGHFQEFEDEYMETMFEFWEDNPTRRVKTGEVANALDVSPASATEMIQRLGRKGLVDYTPYKGARLTEEGLQRGRRMKKRHRLAECFLVDVLQYKGDAHEAACMLEHAFTDELEETLDHLLGRPEVDPDGRDIPRGEPLNVDLGLGPELINLNSVEGERRVRIACIFIDPEDAVLMEDCGLSAGDEGLWNGTSFNLDASKVELSPALQKRILVSLVD